MYNFSERKFVSDRTAASTETAYAALKSPAIMKEEVGTHPTESIFSSVVLK